MVSTLLTSTAVIQDIPEDAILTTEQNAVNLSARGMPTTVSMLNKGAVTGNGPPYHKFGRRRMYVWGKSLRWAQERFGIEQHSTSENV